MGLQAVIKTELSTYIDKSLMARTYDFPLLHGAPKNAYVSTSGPCFSAHLGACAPCRPLPYQSSFDYDKRKHYLKVSGHGCSSG